MEGAGKDGDASGPLTTLRARAKGKRARQRPRLFGRGCTKRIVLNTTEADKKDGHPDTMTGTSSPRRRP